MALKVMELSEARGILEQARTRESRHVVFFREALDYFTSATGTVVVNLLDQEVGQPYASADGETKTPTASSLYSAYMPKVKQYKKDNPQASLRCIKRKPAEVENATTDADGFVCLLVWDAPSVPASEDNEDA